ncbi:MAG TPA: hypothetical protein PK800_03475 [Syntrophorhabdaceae bacterium]|nr:hypothetical protein [Syntrophorhabdaceae bacterium]
MFILGISAFYHDAAAALIENEEIITVAKKSVFQERNTIRPFPKMQLSIALKRQVLR